MSDIYQRIDMLCHALRVCKEKFDVYADHHLKKGTGEGNLKAAINKSYADMIRRVLDSHEKWESSHVPVIPYKGVRYGN